VAKFAADRMGLYTQKLACLAMATSVLLAGAPVFARGKSAVSPPSATSREAREREARGACLNGDYARGVALLSELFLDLKDANYVFNQGRCYEQNERFEDAIGRFREFLRTAGAKDTAAAEKHIAECEALRRNQRPPAAPPVTPPVAEPTIAIPAPAVAPQPVAEVRQMKVSLPQSGSGLRVAGAVILGVGIAGVVTGLALNLKANSVAKSIEPPNTYDRGTESSRKSYEVWSWVGYGAGAAGIVTGTVLYIIGWSSGQNTDRLALAPVVGPNFAGATLRGDF